MAEGTAAGNATEIGPIKATLTAKDASYTATFDACAAETNKLERASKALDVEIRQTEAAMKAIPMETERVATGLKHAAHEAGGLDHALHSLKAQTGRRSALGELAELAMGAGPLIGLSLMGEAVKKASEKMLDLREEFEKGEKSVGQMADELLRSLPIFGSIYEAGRNLREVFTGEEGMAKKLEESAKQAEKVSDAMKELRVSTQEWRDKTAEGAQVLAELSRSSGLTGLKRELAELGTSYADQIRRIDAEYGKRAGEGMNEDYAQLHDVRNKRDGAKAARANWAAGLNGIDKALNDAANQHLATMDKEISEWDAQVKIMESVVSRKLGMATASRLSDEAIAQETLSLKIHSAELAENSRIQSEWLSKSGEVRTGMGPIADYLATVRHLAEAQREGLIDQAHYAEGVKSALATESAAVASLAAEGGAALAGLEAQLRNWGLSEADLAIAKMRSLHATDDQIKAAVEIGEKLQQLAKISDIDKGDVIDTYLAKTKALTDEFDRQAISKLQLADATTKLDEEYKRTLESEAKSWRDKIETPAQKLEENLKHLEAIRAAGDFRNDAEYKAAIKKARQEYEQAIGGDGDHTPRGVDSRSADAADLIARSLNRSAGADIAAKQLAEQMGMGQTLRQIATNTAKAGTPAKPPRYGGL